MARKRKVSRAGRATAGRAASGRFRRTKGKNALAVRLGKKGHRVSCKRHR